MVVVLTGYNRNSKFDLVANGGISRNCGPVLRVTARWFWRA